MQKKTKKLWMWMMVMLLAFNTPQMVLAAESETVETEASKENAVSEAAETEAKEEISSEEDTASEAESLTAGEAVQEESGIVASESATGEDTEEVSTGSKVIFVLIMILMFVAPIILFFILLVIFSKLQMFIMKKTGKIPGANKGKNQNKKKK